MMVIAICLTIYPNFHRKILLIRGSMLIHVGANDPYFIIIIKLMAKNLNIWPGVNLEKL